MINTRAPTLLLVMVTAALALPAGAAHADDAKPARCQYVQIGTLPLRYTGPGQVPSVDGDIDGTPARMLIDTGADSVYLTRTAAQRRALVLYPTRAQVSGVGGRSRILSTRVKSLSIGPLSGGVRPELTVIADTASAPDYDAIVGSSFLLQTDLELDLDAKRLRFFQPRDCDHAVFNIWKEDTVSLPFARSARDGSDNPHVTVSVNGVELDAMIDSGAHRSVLTQDAAARLGILVTSPGVVRMRDAGGVGSASMALWRTPIKTVQIGGEIIKDTELAIIALHENAPAELILGQDFLRAHRVLFAMDQRKLYVAYHGGEAFMRGEAGFTTHGERP